MRRESGASICLPLLAVAWAGVALASCFALWSVSRTIAELGRAGGGISYLSFGMWQAARLPLASAWIAAAATLLAIAIALRAAVDQPEHSARSWWIGGAAVAAGVAAVLAFRGAVAFILQAVVPGHEASWGGRSLPDAISARLLGAGVASALCFLIAIALAVVAFRRGAAALRSVVAVLVVSLSVSAILAMSLGSFSTRLRVTATAGPRAAASISDIRP